MENHKHSKSHNNHNDGHHNHHAMMIKDFKKRFWISLLLTLPLVVMAPMIQSLLGFELRFNGDRYIQFTLSSIIFIYGGWPFIKGLIDETVVFILSDDKLIGYIALADEIREESREAIDTLKKKGIKVMILLTS